MSSPAASEGSRRTWPRLPAFAAFILTIALIWLGGQFVTQGLSDQFVGRRPDWAVLWRADSADAFDALARKSLLNGRYAAAARMSARSLQLSPLSAPTLATFGIAMGHLGRREVADRAMQLAGERGWRDVLTQLWLFRRALELGDVPQAWEHADAVLRRADYVPPVVFAAMSEAAQDPRSIAPLASRLALDPPWRFPFIDYMAYQAPPAATQTDYALLLALEGSANPPTPLEIGRVLRALVIERKYKESFDDWRRLTHAPANAPLLNDGDFSAPQGYTPFDWLMMNGIGWTAAVGDNPQGPGKALKLDYDGFSPPQPMGQMLVLDSGSYRLSGRWLDENGVGAQTLHWDITCATTGARLGRVALPPAPTGQWRDFTLDFTAPGDCPAEWLGLGADAGDISTNIGVWFAGMAIHRTEGSAATKSGAVAESANR